MSWHVGSYIFLGALVTLSIVSVEVSPKSEPQVSRTNEQVEELFFYTPAGPIRWPLYCAVLQTGKIISRFDCYGRFGYYGEDCDVPEWPDGGFVTPVGSSVEYLWGGGIWVGGKLGSDIRLSSSTGIFGNDFSPAGGMPAVEELDYIADHNLRALFSDTTLNPRQGHNYPLYIEIANRSHVFYGNPFNKTIIYDLVITNIGDTLIEDTHLGLYFDTDIGYSDDTSYYTDFWSDDLVGSIPERGIAYAIDNDGDPDGNTYSSADPTRCFAVKLLNTSFTASDTSFNWWATEGPGIDWSPNHSDPGTCDYDMGGFYSLSPEDTYCLMGLSGWDYDQVFTAAIPADDPTWLQFDPSLSAKVSNGSDIKFLLSVGPFDLAPDSSARIQFSTMTGELVHINPRNYRTNLRDSYMPDEFLNNLNFSDLFTVADASDYLADSLLNPLYPPLGVRVIKQEDSVVIEWDPWVFDDVEGYEIFLSELPQELLPHPGLAAPWMEPASLNLLASVGRAHRFTLQDLAPNRIYYFNIANRTSAGNGEASKTIYPILRPYFKAPYIASELASSPVTEKVTISWEELSGEDIDYYNIYQFDTTSDTANLYHPFYDRGGAVTLGLIPKDSFCFDDGCYYYYAMAEHARVDSGIISFSEIAEEGKVYFVTGVNKLGFESRFSRPVTVMHIDPPTEDILVITNASSMFVSYEMIASFYDSVFAGSGSNYLYDIYNVKDTVIKYGSADSLDWHDFSAYRMVIIDDDLPDEGLARYEIRQEGLSKYMLTGGIVIYCGSFNGFTSTNIQTRTLIYRPAQSFIGRFFPVDTIYFVGPGYYILAGFPIEDGDFGCYKVEDSRGVLPHIGFDSARYPFGSVSLPQFWSGTTIPGPVGFKAPVTAEPIYQYRTTSPDSSIMENRTAAIRFKTSAFDNYLFGFHFWYMDPVQVRKLIEAIMPPANCCVAVGDVDHSGGEAPINIADATWLVRYLYANQPEAYCRAEADMNADGSIDLIDLTVLTDFIFKSGPPMLLCK